MSEHLVGQSIGLGEKTIGVGGHTRLKRTSNLARKTQSTTKCIKFSIKMRHKRNVEKFYIPEGGNSEEGERKKGSGSSLVEREGSERVDRE